MPPTPSVSAMVWREAVFLRHLEISDGAGLVAADLEGDDDEIGTVEGLALIGVQLDAGLDAERRDQLADDDFAFLQTLWVDVHQCDLCAGQSRALQHIADDVFHEHGSSPRR